MFLAQSFAEPSKTEVFYCEKLPVCTEVTMTSSFSNIGLLLVKCCVLQRKHKK